MSKSTGRVKESIADYYDSRGVLGEIGDRPVEFALEEELRQQILKGERKRRLQNVSIKLDPFRFRRCGKSPLKNQFRTKP